VVALLAPRPGGWSFVEQSDAKYQKFAYSSRFGFSGDFALYGMATTDSTLAVTDPLTGARAMRARVILAHVADGVALTRWSPNASVRVDTALWGGAPWHVRVHRIVTDRELSLCETGFALPWEPEGLAPAQPSTPELGHTAATSPWGASAIVDLPRGRVERRTAAVRSLSANANVMHPHVIVPSLEVTVPPGRHWLVCAVGASHDAGTVTLDRAPTAPAEVIELLEAFAARPDVGPDAADVGIAALLGRRPANSSPSDER
jgi:hypothetical protein